MFIWHWPQASTFQLSTAFSVAINGKPLNHLSEYKYLGVVLDASLTWNTHIDYLIAKVKKRE